MTIYTSNPFLLYTDEQIFGCTSSEGSAHFVKHLLFGSDLTFFRQIPGSTQCTSAGNNRYLDQWICIFQQPRDRGVSCFMQGNRASFRFCSNLGLLFQTTDDTVYRIQKILLAYKFLSVTLSKHMLGALRWRGKTAMAGLRVSGGRNVRHEAMPCQVRPHGW